MYSMILRGVSLYFVTACDTIAFLVFNGDILISNGHFFDATVKKKYYGDLY